MAKQIDKLVWMSDAALLDMLKALPMDSNLRKLRVKVNDVDCDKAKPGSATNCAISMAVKRMFPNASFVSTKHHGITMTINKHYLHFSQTGSGSKAVLAYDEKGAKPPKLVFTLFSIVPVQPITSERRQRINEARRRRIAEGRPDKVYSGDPLRVRIAKAANKPSK